MLMEEQETRGQKDTELLKSIQTIKNMLIETIKTKIESTQV